MPTSIVDLGTTRLESDGGSSRLAWQLRPPTAENVRAECARRMRLLAGARDDAHLTIILSSATREEVQLLRILNEGGEWSEAEAARATYLKGLQAGIDALRAASNAMEAEPPADYAADSRWQGGS